MNDIIYNFAVLALVSVAAADPGERQRRDSSPLFFELPADAALVLGGINTGFDCGELPFGYYADQANNCALYHVCLPYIENDIYVTRQFTFLCGEGTVFDQERLVFDFPENSISCNEATNYRRANEYFGRPVNFLE